VVVVPLPPEPLVGCQLLFSHCRLAHSLQKTNVMF
jgi:hypothetical protein